MPQCEVTIKPTMARPSLHTRSNPNTATTITLVTSRGRHVFSGLSWSYSATPTGRLTIAGGGFDYAWDITASGPGHIPLYEEMGDGSCDVVITLAAGGAGVVGELNVHGHRIE